MQDDRRNKVIIMGAAGRDFHNFNVVFRNDPLTRVVAFTAAQTPDIAGRTYPPALSGPLYPNGIPIVEESELVPLIKRDRVNWVYFSYSDISHQDVMHKASEVLAAGANFAFLGPESTAIASTKPVISVCAVRTGVGKSSATRRIARFFLERRRQSVIRHPMPYGDLEAQRVQRFGEMDDLERFEATIEEREEYEPLLRMDIAVFAGVDYHAILHRAEVDADLIIWDGGNNDLPFVRPDLHVVLVDPHRPGDETSCHPGEANLRMADLVIINKVDSATPDQLVQVQAGVESVARANVPVILADSVLSRSPTQTRLRANGSWWWATARHRPTAAWPTAPVPSRPDNWALRRSYPAGSSLPAASAMPIAPTPTWRRKCPPWATPQSSWPTWKRR
jgi:predicted GTPase